MNWGGDRGSHIRDHQPMHWLGRSVTNGARLGFGAAAELTAGQSFAEQLVRDNARMGVAA